MRNREFLEEYFRGHCEGFGTCPCEDSFGLNVIIRAVDRNWLDAEHESEETQNRRAEMAVAYEIAKYCLTHDSCL